jgi:hypothetical protein
MEKLSKQEAINVLSAWTALEVLSPQTFKKREDLAGNDPTSVVSFDKGYLPWENGGEKAEPNHRLFYQVIIGTINVTEAVKALIEQYGDDADAEKTTISGQSILGLVIVDQDGYPIKENNAVGISSFAWGVPQTLKGEIKNLSKWSLVERNTKQTFESILRRQNEDGKNLPLNKETIDEAFSYLVSVFDIPKTMFTDTKFAIRLSLKTKDSPRPLLLNSFYLNDLDTAQIAIDENTASENLLKYLGIKIPSERHDILYDNKVLENIIAPKYIPPSRWPGAGNHPLILRQQAAVNASISELEHGGILAINGPPGTGKTTLLRDIIASIITSRAEALLKFSDPAMAFINSGHKIKVANGWLHLYTFDKTLKGFEILIASSNNKAVENISTELPSLKAIAENADELRYFHTLSNEIFGSETWGLIAAVLGNTGNVNRFFKKFWWDKDFGFSTYLAQAAGMPQIVEIKDTKTGKIDSRPPRIIQENNPPRNHNDALIRWQQACKRFKQVLGECKNKLDELEKIRQLIHNLQNLEIELELGNTTVEDAILKHQKAKANLTARIFNFPAAQKWKLKNDKLSNCYKLGEKTKICSEKLGSHLIDNQLFLKNHDDMNLTTPWCDAETQTLRDKVFIESMKLSKAFIDAAAKPLRHNLGILMRFFDKQNDRIDTEILKLMPDLWSSFFLVVPSVSTTFASVGRMLEHLPQNYLGWLLIDEAGQALPQAAVGAIMKTKRAIITGDPLQVEPVVILPDNVTESICNQFEVDVNRFNAPMASVQTLADMATSYFAEFHTKDGSRTVGVPLLVHRRCAEPMFSISNIIAYERLMVQAKNHKTSLIRDCLGDSIWFDVQGQAHDKWCVQEGEKVIELLNQLKSAAIFPDLYIVTPFKIVAINLRRMIKDRGVMNSWINVDASSWIHDRIGTVHTVQGREAEAVILVLGATRADQKGTRNWAGRTPNLLNVAVTRAKEVIYVIGNKTLWKEAKVFRELHDRV